jgi:hypothetical protein
MNAREIATCFREDCRTLRDSLQLEMVVAQYCLRMRDAVSVEGVPVGDALSAGVVGSLEHDCDPLAHALLKALAYIGTGDARERSRHAATRLAAAGVGLPPEFSDVCEARAVGAWRSTEGAFAGEYVMFVDFEYPLGAPHALALFVEPTGGGRVKHIGLTHPVRDFPGDAGFHPDAMDALEVPHAGELLGEAMERAFGTDLAETDDYSVLIAAARVGAMQAAPVGSAPHLARRPAPAGSAPHSTRAASVPAPDARQREYT